MNRDEAREQIRSSWRDLLANLTGLAKERVNGEESYICPLCGHGSNGDGLTFDPRSRDHNGLKCFGCGFSGDVIDLYQKTNGIDYNTALNVLAAELGLTIDRSSPQEDFKRSVEEKFNQAEKTQQGAFFKRGIEYYKECAIALQESEEAISYLKQRKISLATAEAFKIGFDPTWQSPTALDSGKRPPRSKRLIIPTSRTHYFARAIEPPRNDSEKKYQKMNEGEAGLFNAACLHSADPRPIFITEGAFDALSIIEAGGNALALNSTSNTDLLLETLEAKPTDKTLILALDNDTAGRKATKDLRAGLKRINASFIVAYNLYPNGCKDANEALQRNEADFIAAVGLAMGRSSARPDAVDSYIDNLMAKEIEAFKEGMKGRTGLRGVDEGSGGLFPGLYVIAAISSLGKTTFAHQIADYLAESGREVLYFSLEQSALELVTKSLARLTAKRDIGSAVTSLSIRCGNFPPQVVEAHKEYREKVGNRLSIIEGNFNCDVGYIGDYVRKYIRDTEQTPVVFVDYLQILQPSDKERRQGTKEIVDETVTELKRLSRELGLTIFVICSVNRSNYLVPIDFESLKESGSIEYTADCVWGLQLQCLSDNPIFSEANKITERREAVKAAKNETPRKIEFVCLKNRNGKPHFTAPLLYYSAYDLFVDADQETAEDDFIFYRRR